MTQSAKVDLHLHSVVSDGRLTPTELVRKAHANGVRRMALTDHDTTDGVDEAIGEGQRLGVEVIPGIELSADIPGSEVHVLGYFLEYRDPDFQTTLARFREGRVDRAQAMVARLAEMGAPISWERVKALAGDGSVGRPHVAEALLEAGHVASIKEAFDRFLARNGPAYVERSKLTPAEAIQLIHSVKGTAVLAHPREGQGNLDLVPSLRADGLNGIEVYYFKDYGSGSVEELLGIARAHGLVATGGSDYHGFPMNGVTEVTNEPGTVAIPPEVVDRLFERRTALFGVRP